MTATSNITFHEATELFPLDVVGGDFQGLVNDIRDNGLHVPLVMFDGKLIDGRRGFIACEKLGVAPAFVEWDGTAATVVPYVVSLNVFRRHLNASQRAMIGVQILPEFERQARDRQKQGRTLHAQACNPSGESADLAGQLVNVSGDSIRRAKVVLQHPLLAEAVTDGVLRVKDAADISPQPESIQQLAIERVQAGYASCGRNAVKQLLAERSSSAPTVPTKPRRTTPVLQASELNQAGKSLQLVGKSLVVAAGSLTAKQIRSLKIVHDNVNVFDALKCLRAFLEHVAEQM